MLQLHQLKCQILKASLPSVKLFAKNRGIFASYCTSEVAQDILETFHHDSTDFEDNF